MNLHHLKVFWVVSQAGSISAGAQQLHISQPAVTREIRDLEQSLGLTLFDRLPRGIRLTEGGQRLQHFAERIFTLEHAAERELLNFAQLHHGEINLAASNTIGTYWLPAVLTRFRQKHPGIRLQLLISNTQGILQQLDDGLISLGFVEGTFSPGRYHNQLLQDDCLLPVVSPKHPLAKARRLRLAHLQQHDLYLRESGSGSRISVEQLYQQHGLEAQPSIVVTSSEALKQLISEGQGIAWLSPLTIQSELSNGSLCCLDLADSPAERTLHVLWRADSQLSPAAATLLEQVQQASPTAS